MSAVLDVPVVQGAGARDAARRTRCLSNLRQLALAHQLYVQDHDETLPSWQLLHRGTATTWVEFMSPYFRDAKILDERLTTTAEKRQFTWLADYALCAWGPGGRPGGGEFGAGNGVDGCITLPHARPAR